MSSGDYNALLAVGACLIALVAVIGWLALSTARRTARHRASWQRFAARSRLLSELGRVLWGPPKLTDQRKDKID